MDFRHRQRIKIVQGLFSHTFQKKTPRKQFLNTFDGKTISVIEKKEYIDNLIQKYASKFPIAHIAKIDVAILELSIYDMLFDKKAPPKVIIDEAIELAKELGSGRSFAFINAVLGKIYKEYYEKN